MLAGCGSSGGGSPDGTVGSAFSAAQTRAAAQALSHLAQTSIPRTVLATSVQIGQAPTLCNLLPIDGTPGTFHLYVAWNPTGANGLWAPRSMLEASISRASARADRVRVWTSSATSSEPPALKASFIRAALGEPSARCEALQNGSLTLRGQ